MKRARKPIIASLTIAMTALKAAAADFNYDHNGSTMRVNVDGNQVRIFYHKPRAGLKGVGVRPGTLLFNGTLANGYLEGMSRIFNANCGEVDYFVYGDFRPGRTFKLAGAAPVLSNMSCRIVDNTYEGSNANLLFTALGSASPNPVPSSVARGCVKGVRTTLNVRVGPGSNYGRIAEIPANSCGVQVLDRCQDNWCAIEYGNTLGWVSMRYIQR